MAKEQLASILVVDDTAANLDLLVATLGDRYSVSVASSGEEALSLVERVHPEVILLDIVMPGLDGYAVCRELKRSERFSEIPVIFLTGIRDSDSKARGFEAGAVDYVTKPFDVREVSARVNTHLSLKRAKEQLANQNATLERMVEERTRELVQTQQVTFESLAVLAETRDNETGGHIRRTQRYVRVIARHLAAFPDYRDYLTPTNLRLISESAPLHDIGKVGVPDHILLKPGKLTPEEFDRMKTHTTIGRNALLKAEASLGTNSFLSFAREIAYSHHEKWDGSGYPAGLREHEIPVSARIMALADVYDALVSKRVYKPPFPHRRAIEMIDHDIGTHFDPSFRPLLDAAQREMWTIASELADTEEERLALGEL